MTNQKIIDDLCDTSSGSKMMTDEKVLAMRAVGDQIKELDEKLRETEEKIQNLYLRIHNIPLVRVPQGKDSEANQEDFRMSFLFAVKVKNWIS